MDISEEQARKDIQAMVSYLKFYHPENANELFAVMMLEEMQQTVHIKKRQQPTSDSKQTRAEVL